MLIVLAALVLEEWVRSRNMAGVIAEKELKKDMMDVKRVED